MKNYPPGPSSMNRNGPDSSGSNSQKPAPNVAGMFALGVVTQIVTAKPNRSKIARNMTFQFKHITSLAFFNGNKDFGSKKHICLSNDTSES